MIKEDSYRIKFERLQPWIPVIFQVIKKDLRNDHLLKNSAFAQKHFPKRALDKLTNEEFAAAYIKEICEGDEELGEKVSAHWVMKNAELYQFFVTQLSKINPQFDEIQSFSPEFSGPLLTHSVSEFGATAVYIFCVMNAVVLTADQFDFLRDLALQEVAATKPQQEKGSFGSVEEACLHYEKEMRKLTEKYEQKMQGTQRKYFQDIEGLKKQIGQLHKKLGEKAVGV